MKIKVVSKIMQGQTRGIAYIRKLIASPYDMGFKSSNKRIKGNKVGYNMFRQYLNFKT